MSMRKAKTPIFLAMCFLAVAVMFGDEGLKHDGRDLDAWISDAGPYSSEETRQKAYRAIRTIGTNALPVLLRRITYEEPTNDRTRELETRIDAIYCFDALKESAEPAIPALLSLLQTDEHSGYAGEALGAIGGKALPELLKGLTNNNAFYRRGCCAGLGVAKTNRQVVIPLIEPLKKDPDASVRQYAIFALIRLSEGDYRFTLLIEALDSNDDTLVSHAAYMLGKMGSEARSTLPRLRKVADQLHGNARYSANTAIRRIEAGVSSKVKQP